VWILEGKVTRDQSPHATREVQLLLTGWWRRRPRPMRRAPAWTGGVCSSTLRGTCTDRRACCHSESWPQSLPLGRDWAEPVGPQSVATLPCHQYNSSLLDTCIRSSFNYHLTRSYHCYYHHTLIVLVHNALKKMGYWLPWVRKRWHYTLASSDYAACWPLSEILLLLSNTFVITSPLRIPPHLKHATIIHYHVKYLVVLLRFQNVSCRSVSVGFAEKTSVFGSV